MQPIVDAELTLRGAGGGYQAELFVETGFDSPPRYGPFAAPLDLERLRAEAGDPAAYGRALSDMLFDADGLREALAEARGIARARGGPLRLRLWLASGAEELHALAWELMTLPGRSEPLATREDILFSRYLPAGADAPPPRPKDRPRALVAVASPEGLESLGLAPIDAAGWQAHAETGLVGMEIERLPRDGERCTLARLVERIPGRDVLFLVCHGKVIGGEGQILLEDEQGGRAPVKAGELARRLAGTLHLPRLAVLVVCESATPAGGAAAAIGEAAAGGISAGDAALAAGSAAGLSPAGEGELPAALGPRLVALGIPAVLAVNGALSFETADRFFPALFRALQEDGAIDRAVSLARRAIAGQPDERAPVLLMSLESGRLWSDAEEPAPREPAEGPARPQAGSAEVDQRVLYAALAGEAFTLSDLEELCFTLGIDWDNLRGQTKGEKARALIRYCVSRGRYEELLAAVLEARPGLEL